MKERSVKRVPVHKYVSAEAPPAWRFGIGDGDVVLKSAVYIARNFKDYRFPHLASDEELKEVLNIVREALKNFGADEIKIDRISKPETKILYDKRIIPECFLNNAKHRSVHIKDGGKGYVAVNEEDHVLIVCKREGLGFFELLDKAFKVDDLLDEAADIAYDETYGYLTSLPARVGSGLRAAALLHLPALSYTKNIKATAEVANKMEIDFFPLFGTKEKEWQGNLFLVSNHRTIGLPEVDTIKRVEAFAREVAVSERKGRDALDKYRKDALSDVVWRALGLLERAKTMTEKEAADAASKLQLGSDMGIIKKLPDTFFGEVYTLSRDAYIRNLTGGDKDINHLRALLANRKLQGVN